MIDVGCGVDMLGHGRRDRVCRIVVMLGLETRQN